MADDDAIHDDDTNDPRRAAAIAIARQIVAQAPDHPTHRHGVAVGFAAELTRDAVSDGREYIAIVAVVQGVDVPCWVALDDDDLDRIRVWIDRRDQLAQASSALVN